MKRLILFFAISLSMHYADAQTTINTTITASFSKYGITSGDTTFFSYHDSRGTTLQRFFDRHIRIPQKSGTPDLETGSCTLYFIIDTAGNVTKTWCDSVTNKEVEKEVLRVVGRLTGSLAGNLASLKPTRIKGKPVVTEVMAKVIMIQSDSNDSQQDLYKRLKADVLVVWASPAKRKNLAIGN
jgi:hypothetical protein